MQMVWRLIRTQLKPYTRQLILRVVIAAIIASSPYAFSFLGKWLVDSALQVTGPPKAQVVADTATGTQADTQADFVTGEDGQSADGADPEVRQAAPLGIEWKARTAEEKTRLLLIFLAISLGIHLGITALSGWSEYLNSKTVQEMTYGLRSSVNEKLATADRSIVSREQTGQLMTRVMDDAAGIPGNLTNLVINICTQIMMLILGLMLLLRLDPAMTWVAVLALPFYAVACIYWLPRLRTNTNRMRDSGAALNGHLIERLTHVATIKNYAQEEAEIERFGVVIDEQLDITRRQQNLNLGFNSATGLITSLATLAVLGLGFLKIKSGDMQLGEVLAFYQVTAQLFVPISALVGMTTVSQTLQILGSRVFSVLDTPNELAEAEDAVRLGDIKGEVAYEKVSLQYQEGGPLAVEELSCTIPAGKTTCIVGPTGCGKSSMLTLLLRLYDPNSGRILLDQTDIRHVQMRQLRRSIGVVSATSTQFSGTFAENIAFGVPKAKRDRIVSAATVADLHDYIMSLPKSYETKLGRGGLTLEAEELAKLSLARAIATHPAILVIDNTFAALPEATERKIRANLRANRTHKTIVIATSRLSIAENADLILVMERGQIVQQGTHKQLMKVPGLYRRMYTRQMGL